MAQQANFCVTAIGADRPGIVAAVAEALLEVGGNVEDSAMTILGGQFANVLLVATDSDEDRLGAALEAHTQELGLTIHVSGVAAAPATRATPTHVLSVYGADRPGILAGVARALATAHANVTDLETRLLNPTGDAVYAMILELEASDEAAVATALENACTRLGVDHTLRPLDAETL